MHDTVTEPIVLASKPGETIDRALTRSWDWLVYPTLVFAATRALIWLVGYLALSAMPRPPAPQFWHRVPDFMPLDIWARFDSAYYLSIVEVGYSYSSPMERSTVTFFPLYPLLTRIAWSVVPNVTLAGVVVSLVCFLAALIVLYRLTALEFGDVGVSRRSVFYLAVFPLAFVFGAVYSESVFLLCGMVSAYFARRRMWILAGVAAGLASAARFVGIGFGLFLLFEILRAHGLLTLAGRDSAPVAARVRAVLGDWRALVGLALSPLGLLAFMAHLYVRFGDPLVFWRAQAFWRREALGPIGILTRDVGVLLGGDWAHGQIEWRVLINVGALALVSIVSVVALRRLGVSYFFVTVFQMVVPLWSLSESLARFAVVCFPVFMILGQWGRHATVERLIVTSSAILLGLCTAAFVNWWFVG